MGERLSRKRGTDAKILCPRVSKKVLTRGGMETKNRKKGRRNLDGRENIFVGTKMLHQGQRDRESLGLGPLLTEEERFQEG